MQHKHDGSLKRLKSAKGHLQKVIEMVEEDSYCIDILQQSMAVQSALRRVDEEILSRHLETCVRKSLSTKGKDKCLKEIVEIFRRGRK